MLGKLFKYDFKSQAKIHCGIYLLILISSVLTFGALKLQKKYPNAEIFNIMVVFSIIVFVISIIAALFVTFILSIMRYRNNLLKDEGYLMHTLPVPFWKLYISKMAASLSWYVLDAVAIITAICIAIGGFEWLKTIELMALVSFGIIPEEITITGELSLAGIAAGVKIGAMIGFALLMLVTVICNLSQIYVCLSLGYTSYSNRDVMSFVVYIITYMITQVISFVGVIIVGLMDFGSMSAMFGETTVALEVDATNYMQHLMIFSMLLTVVMAAAYIFISLRTMTKKLNLE